MRRSVVYTLHFWPPYKHAAHYTGSSDRLRERLTDHALARGARLTEVQVKAGGSWVLGRVEPGGRDRERYLKRHEASRHCDVCSALQGRDNGRLTTEQALSKAGWNAASEYEQSLLLEIFGISEPPTKGTVPPALEVREMVPAPSHEPVKYGPEIDALVDALIESWTSPHAEPAREMDLEAGA
jgi:hypothetical protein